MPRLLCAPLALSEADLGVESEGLQSLLAKRREVEEEVSQLVGMAPLKAFLAELNAKVTYVERGGDPRLLEGCLNVVLTGNPGAGKTTAARLLFRALRAYGTQSDAPRTHTGRLTHAQSHTPLTPRPSSVFLPLQASSAKTSSSNGTPSSSRGPTSGGRARR